MPSGLKLKMSLKEIAGAGGHTGVFSFCYLQTLTKRDSTLRLTFHNFRSEKASAKFERARTKSGINNIKFLWKPGHDL